VAKVRSAGGPAGLFVTRKQVVVGFAEFGTRMQAEDAPARDQLATTELATEWVAR